MEEKKLYVGYAARTITPPLGNNLPGYGAAPRPSLGIIDDLFVYAVAFSDGENKAILFNCDMLGVFSTGADRIRQNVGE